MPKAYECIGNGIIMARGTDVASNEGHAFVIDGYYLKISTACQYERPDELSSWILVGTRQTKYGYNHINWGWKGVDNGFFQVDVFDSSQGFDYSQISRSGNFSKNFKYYVVEYNQ